jgi:alpha-galactosidase
MKKIVFIGGGSAKFVTKLVRDMFTFPALQELQITLMDIAPERMERTEQLLQMVIAEQGLPATVECATDQRAALAGADYVIVTIMVGGFEKYYSDGAIPAS